MVPSRDEPLSKHCPLLFPTTLHIAGDSSVASEGFIKGLSPPSPSFAFGCSGTCAACLICSRDSFSALLVFVFLNCYLSGLCVGQLCIATCEHKSKESERKQVSQRFSYIMNTNGIFGSRLNNLIKSDITES